MTRIAIVEDDFDLSHIIRDVLRDAGHDVVSYFKPSPDILESFKSYRPDLVILDMRLNSYVTGWDIISALKADPALCDIPVIVATGAPELIEQHQAWFDENDVSVLHKPFELEDLDQLVNRKLVAPGG